MEIKNCFITIQGWMVEELGLKGNELLVYAIIYGFAQGKAGEFSGSLSYLATWLNSSKRTVLNTLQSLVEKELIEKTDIVKNKVKFCIYVPSEKFLPSGEKISLGVVKNFPKGGEKISPNNNSNNIDNNICNLEVKRAIKKKSIKKKFIPPTLEQVKDYCVNARKNNVDYKRFYDYYEANDWNDGNGKPLVSWKQKIIAVWEKDNKKAMSTQPPEDNRKAFRDMTEEEKREYWRKIDAEIAEHNRR